MGIAWIGDGRCVFARSRVVSCRMLGLQQCDAVRRVVLEGGDLTEGRLASCHVLGLRVVLGFAASDGPCSVGWRGAFSGLI
jgi:hypothetical protein